MSEEVVDLSDSDELAEEVHYKELNDGFKIDKAVWDKLYRYFSRNIVMQCILCMM